MKSEKFKDLKLSHCRELLYIGFYMQALCHDVKQVFIPKPPLSFGAIPSA